MPPELWALTHAWDPEDPARCCFTCGARPSHWYSDGSPAYRCGTHPVVYPEDLEGWVPAVRQPQLTVTLDDAEIAQARSCAQALVSAQGRDRDRWGTAALDDEGRLAAHLVGAGGEIAAARLLGLPWACEPGRYGRPDVGRYEIRTRRRPEAGLILKPTDEAPTVLMIGTPWTFRLAGWVEAPRTWRTPRYEARHMQDLRGSWLVPQGELRDPRDLPELGHLWPDP